MEWPTISEQSHTGDLPRRGDAADLDRRADLLLAEGRHAQAERLAHIAMELRTEREGVAS